MTTVKAVCQCYAAENEAVQTLNSKMATAMQKHL